MGVGVYGFGFRIVRGVLGFCVCGGVESALCVGRFKVQFCVVLVGCWVLGFGFMV